MVYRNFVQVGRVCRVSYGEDYGKTCVIVDVRDQQTVLVDGPGFQRVQYPMNRLTLTKFTIDVLRGARTGTVAKAYKKADIANKYAALPVAKKFERFNVRANLTDYERFSVMVNRKRRSATIK